MRDVWADHPHLNLTIGFISGGQAAALYICGTYGGDESLNKKRIWTRFENFIPKTEIPSGVPLAVIESGSSSMACILISCP